MSVVQRLKINQERGVNCAFVLGQLAWMQTDSFPDFPLEIVSEIFKAEVNLPLLEQ
jgi:hypothetical protein